MSSFFMSRSSLLAFYLPISQSSLSHHSSNHCFSLGCQLLMISYSPLMMSSIQYFSAILAVIAALLAHYLVAVLLNVSTSLCLVPSCRCCVCPSTSPLTPSTGSSTSSIIYSLSRLICHHQNHHRLNSICTSCEQNIPKWKFSSPHFQWVTFLIDVLTYLCTYVLLYFINPNVGNFTLFFLGGGVG